MEKPETLRLGGKFGLDPTRDREPLSDAEQKTTWSDWHFRSHPDSWLENVDREGAQEACNSQDKNLDFEFRL